MKEYAQGRAIAMAINRWVSSLISQVSRSMFLIFVPIGNSACDKVYDFVKSATGFAIDKNVVVTVAHIDPVERICLADLEGRRFSGKVIAVDSRWDTAFIETGESLHPLSLSLEQPPVGSLVIVSGMPYGLLRPYYAVGVVSGYKVNTFIEGKYVEGLMMLSAPTMVGMSGGPVIDLEGNVVGMIIGNGMNINEFALALPAKRILYSYRILKTLGRVDHIVLGLKVVEGLAKGVEELVISSVFSENIKNICGLDVGDSIISINNRDLKTLEDLWDSLDEAILSFQNVLKIKFYDYSDKMLKECIYPIS